VHSAFYFALRFPGILSHGISFMPNG
jgi:hypothetical protein